MKSHAGQRVATFRTFTAENRHRFMHNTIHLEISNGLEVLHLCQLSGYNFGGPKQQKKHLPSITSTVICTPLSALTSVETTSSSSVLTLSNATADQLGQYTCRTGNEFGSDSATVAVLANTEDPSGKCTFKS